MSGLRSMDRRRGCGKVGIPRPLRDFQAQWEPCFWVSTERLFHSLSPPRRNGFQQRHSCGVETAHYVWAIAHAQGAVQVLVHQDATTCQGVAPRGSLDLQNPVADLDGVVAVHHAFLLHRKDSLQVLAPQPQKRAARLRRSNAEPPVELRDVFFPQKPVGLFRRGDSAQAQLLRQTPLPGAETSLAASSRLRRVRRNHANPQLPQGSAHLRHSLRIDLAARLRCFKEVAGPVAVQRAEHSVTTHHLAQRLQHRARRFLLDQLRVIDFAGRVIQRHQQVVAAVIGKPGVRAAVQIQQHSRQRSPHPPLAVRPAPPPLAHQPRALQGQLDPGITQADAVLLPELLVKVAHVEIEILLPVQPQDLLRRLQRYPPRTWPATTAIPQSVIPPFLIPPVPTPHLPLADPEDLRRLPPGDPLGHRSQDHFLYFHRPLPGDASRRFHAVLRLVFLPQVAPPKRTFHVLIAPDTSRATDTYFKYQRQIGTANVSGQNYAVVDETVW